MSNKANILFLWILFHQEAFSDTKSASSFLNSAPITDQLKTIKDQAQEWSDNNPDLAAGAVGALTGAAVVASGASVGGAGLVTYKIAKNLPLLKKKEKPSPPPSSPSSPPPSSPSSSPPSSPSSSPSSSPLYKGLEVAGGNLTTLYQNTKDARKEANILGEASLSFKDTFTQALERLSSLEDFTKTMEEAASRIDKELEHQALQESDPIQQKWNQELLKWHREQITLKFLDRQLSLLQKEASKTTNVTETALIKKKIAAVQTQRSLYESLLQRRQGLLEGKGAAYATLRNSGDFQWSGWGNYAFETFVMKTNLDFLGIDPKSIRRDYMVYEGDLKTLEEEAKAIGEIYETHGKNLGDLERTVLTLDKENEDLQKKIQEKLQTLRAQDPQKAREAKDLKEALRQTAERKKILKAFLLSPVQAARNQGQESQPLTIELRPLKSLKEALSQKNYKAAQFFQETHTLSERDQRDYKTQTERVEKLAQNHLFKIQLANERIPAVSSPKEKVSTREILEQAVLSLLPFYKNPDPIKKSAPPSRVSLTEKMIKSPLPAPQVIKKIEKMNKKLQQDLGKLEERRENRLLDPPQSTQLSREIKITQEIITKNQTFLENPEIKAYRTRQQELTQSTRVNTPKRV